DARRPLLAHRAEHSQLRAGERGISRVFHEASLLPERQSATGAFAGHGTSTVVVGGSMKPNLVGVNHVALQVDDIEESVAFYTDLFQPTDVSRIPGAAFLRMGDQFLALFERGPRTEEPHFALALEDKQEAPRACEEAGVEILPGRFFDSRDPSGNRLQIVQ